jgi:hypothetical protein
MDFCSFFSTQQFCGRPIIIKANQNKTQSMQIVSGQIAKAYAVEANCPWCKMSKLRYDIEFAALALEGKQVIDSSYIVKGICVHCFTVCDELPKMDFVCAKCQ